MTIDSLKGNSFRGNYIVNINSHVVKGTTLRQSYVLQLFQVKQY